MPIDNGETPSIDPHDTSQGSKKASSKKPMCYRSTDSKGKSNENQREEDTNDMEIEKQATPAVSLYRTRVNISIRVGRSIKNLSVIQALSRIINIIKIADSKARLIGLDENNKETTFDEAEPRKGSDDEIRQEMEKFLKGGTITKRNEATGIIEVRTEISIGEIIKNNQVQQALNEYPRIFLKINYLDCDHPLVAGFFTNVSPRADRPEIFAERMKNIMYYDDGKEFPKYQIDYAPINAGNIHCIVIKILTATVEDKEKIREFFIDNEKHLQLGDFYSEVEFYSGALETRMKILDWQSKYARNNRTLFIEGFRSLQGMTNQGPKPEDKPKMVGSWFLDHTTGMGSLMFERIYEPVGKEGTIELVVEEANANMATDWIQYAKSELLKELNLVEMNATFIDAAKERDENANKRAWTPHQLTKKAEKYPEIEIKKGEPKRRNQTSNMDFKNAETTYRSKTSMGKPTTKEKPTTPVKNQASDGFITVTRGKSAPWAPSQNKQIEEVTQIRNPYKAATEVQDKRLATLERQMASVMKDQKSANEAVKKVQETAIDQGISILKLGGILQNNQDATEKMLDELEDRTWMRIQDLEKRNKARMMNDRTEERSPVKKAQRQYSPEKQGQEKTAWDSDDKEAASPVKKALDVEFGDMEETEEEKEAWASHQYFIDHASDQTSSDPGNDGAAQDK